MTVSYRDALPADYTPLATMARESFTETFGHLYPQNDLQAFLDSVFGPDGLGAELRDAALSIRLAQEDSAIAGFAKVGPVSLPGPLPTPAMELKQLYVLAPWQGRGVAQTLMDWALAKARAAKVRFVHLSVFADNSRAMAFYRRYGFSEIGRYGFVVGSQIDDERIWSRPL